MVRRVFAALHREIRGLHEAAYILALFGFGSQILALVRDKLLAHQFGAGVTLDIYNAAFRIPDFLFAVFASVLSVYVLIPFVAERMEEDMEKARALLSAVLTWFLIGYGAAALLLVVFSQSIAAAVFPGFGPGEQALLVPVMRILLLQAFFLSLSSLFGVVTQLHRKFLLYAVSPLLYNLGIIAGVVVLYPMWGLRGMAIGAAIGAFLHFAVQAPFVAESGLLPRITVRPPGALLVRIIRNSLPRALALMLQQFVLLALTGIATLMAAGSVTVLQFAYNLQSVPLTIIGVSYSVAAFPTLARLYSAGDRAAFSGHVYAALRHIIFWSIPAIAFFAVIRAQLVRVIYGSGLFDWGDTRLTAAALALFALSLAAQAVHLLIIRAYYAAGDTRTPLVTTLFSSAGIVLAAAGLYTAHTESSSFVLALADLLRVSDVPGTEALILPFAFSVVFLIHSSVLSYLFIRTYGREAMGDIGRVLAQSVGAALALSAGAYLALNLLIGGFRTDTFLGVFMQGFIAGVIGIAAAAVFLILAGSREITEIGRSLRHRFRGIKPLAPQEKE